MLEWFKGLKFGFEHDSMNLIVDTNFYDRDLSRNNLLKKVGGGAGISFSGRLKGPFTFYYLYVYNIFYTFGS